MNVYVMFLTNLLRKRGENIEGDQGNHQDGYKGQIKYNISKYKLPKKNGRLSKTKTKICRVQHLNNRLGFALQQRIKEQRQKQLLQQKQRKIANNNTPWSGSELKTKNDLKQPTSAETSYICMLPTKLLDIIDLKGRAIKIVPNMTIIGPVNPSLKYPSNDTSPGLLHTTDIVNAVNILNNGNAQKFVEEFLTKEVDGIYTCRESDRNSSDLTNFINLSASYRWRTLLFGLSLLRNNSNGKKESNYKALSHLILLFDGSDGAVNSRYGNDGESLMTVKIHIKEPPCQLNKFMELVEVICQRKNDSDVGDFLGIWNMESSHSGFMAKHHSSLYEYRKSLEEDGSEKEKFESIWRACENMH